VRRTLGWDLPAAKHTSVTARNIDAAVRAIPKVHLHCHLEGTLRPATFRELAERAGIVVPEPVYGFPDFAGFLRTFMDVCRSLRAPEDYRRLAREFVQDARERGVMYGELFVSPSAWAFFHPELDLCATLEAIAQELQSAEFAHFSLIVDVTRNLGVESAMKTTDLAASLAHCNVVGIGLGGDEVRFPAEMFRDVFAYARSRGLHTVAHAGEAAGAQSVRAAVEVLGAERIGHGVRALEDEAVVAMLADRSIPLEICPTSNFLTGSVPRERPHPLIDLYAAGIPIVVDADDPALFGCSIDAEYGYVAELLGVDVLGELVANAVEASFAPAGLKEAMRSQLNQAVSV
jgi:adenosine deaminase